MNCSRSGRDSAWHRDRRGAGDGPGAGYRQGSGRRPRRGRHIRLLALALLAALVASACETKKPPDAGAPYLTLIAVSSLAGTSTYGVNLEIPRATTLESLSISIWLPRGLGASDGGSPEGATFEGVAGGSAQWKMRSVSGPAVVGPFVVRLDGGEAPPPKFADARWNGGSAHTDEAKVRAAGVAIGEGFLRSTPTTSSILIGHGTEITGYTLGLWLLVERRVLATRDAIDVPPPPAEVSPSALVMSGHITVEPAPVGPIVLEMTAPRPLPPFAPVMIERAEAGGDYEPVNYAGRVGPLGDRIFIPVTATGRYRGYVPGDWYRRGQAPMSERVLASREMVSARASQVAPDMKLAVLPALAAVDSDVALELLAVERSLPSTRMPEAVPRGMSFNGVATCSSIACVGVSAPAGEVNFCDLALDITACAPIERPGEEVTVSVSGRDDILEYCQTQTCFVPGRGIVENRPGDQAVANPVGFAVTEGEMLFVSSAVAA